MNDLIILALKEEAPTLQQYPNVFFTGVGKVNAALTVAKLIHEYRPKRIFNFGTAGGITQTGLVHCTQFIQRDMLCMPLMPNPGETPFETDHIIVNNPTGAICSTGDNFVTNNNLDIPADVVDMEAYALAKACRLNGIEFHCYKYVSDQANHTAGTDWQTQVASGEHYYIKVLNDFKLL
jgi:adenosylhomocysteine nucleosidase